MDWDITWRNTSKAQEKALELAMVQEVDGLTEFEVAELMLTSQQSLWYTQAKSWVETPPDIGKSAPIWQQACQVIVEIVDLGYDEETKTWWPLNQLEHPLAKTFLLMDFGVMLKQYRQQSLDVISGGFWPFLDIVCGVGWHKRYLKGMKNLKAVLTAKEKAGV